PLRMFGGVCYDDADAGVPAPQPRRPHGVVVVEEVLDRMCDAAARPLAMTGRCGVRPTLVRVFERAPLIACQHGDGGGDHPPIVARSGQRPGSSVTLATCLRR